ncbi:MAG: hypothetical protein RL318_2623 [Fibrobacterota bacterium]
MQEDELSPSDNPEQGRGGDRLEILGDAVDFLAGAAEVLEVVPSVVGSILECLPDLDL